MTPEEFTKLPIIGMNDTIGNDPTGYTEIQLKLLPYIASYHNLLWLMFFGTFFFLIYRFLVLPRFSNQQASTPAPATSTMPDNVKTSTWRRRYWKFFSLQEIQDDVILRWFGGAVILGFMASFRVWESSYITTQSAAYDTNALCWPFFQSCYDWFFMTARPHGYIQNTIFMIMLGVMFLASYALAANRIIMAHACILILFLWKFYITSINYMYNANYDYYQTAFTLIFLFCPHRRFFGSLSVVFFYFLSTATKIHESWTLGTYFTAMKTGLPIFPKEMTLLCTNLVIFMEMVGAWFLFSANRVLQRTAFVFFVIFHLYSGTLVGYHYPTIVTPSLIVFFGPLFRPFQTIPFNIKSTAGWSLMLALFCAQMISHTIPGDEKLTLEGNFYGLYMFEANHQCQVRIYNNKNETIYSKDGTSARDRCDPYRYWFTAKQRYCLKKSDNLKFRLTVLHSINGGPFYRIVDEPDLCSLEYKPFTHNEWIKTEKEAEPVARPRQNLYR